MIRFFGFWPQNDLANIQIRPDQVWTVFTILILIYRVIPKNIRWTQPIINSENLLLTAPPPHLTWQSGKYGDSIKRDPHRAATTQKTAHKNCPRFLFFIFHGAKQKRSLWNLPERGESKSKIQLYQNHFVFSIFRDIYPLHLGHFTN